MCGDPSDDESLALLARLELDGREGLAARGRLDHLRLPGHERLRHRGLSIRQESGTGAWLLDVPGTFRTVGGDVVRRMALTVTDREEADLEVEVVHDFHLLEDAVARLVQRTRSGTSTALGGGAFQRRVLMSALFECLGGEYADTGLDSSDMPPAMLATNPADLDPAGTLPPVPSGRRP